MWGLNIPQSRMQANKADKDPKESPAVACTVHGDNSEQWQL